MSETKKSTSSLNKWSGVVGAALFATGGVFHIISKVRESTLGGDTESFTNTDSVLVSALPGGLPATATVSSLRKMDASSQSLETIAVSLYTAGATLITWHFYKSM